jgi:dipeptidase E
MQTLYLISGLDMRKGELDFLLPDMLKDVERVLIIPFATPQQYRESWRQSLQDAFTKHKKLRIDMYEDNQVGQYDMLFLTGGMTDKLLQEIEKQQLTEEIRNFPGIIAGISAGAMIYGPKTVILKDHDYPQSQVMEGLNITNYMVSPHYTTHDDEELKLYSNQGTILALTDETVAIVTTKTKLQGNAFLFQHGNKIQVKGTLAQLGIQKENHYK